MPDVVEDEGETAEVAPEKFKKGEISHSMGYLK